MLGKVEGRRSRGQQRMKSLDGNTDLMNVSLSKPQEIMKVRKIKSAVVHGVTKSWTWISNWKTAAPHINENTVISWSQYI